jgi:hypothetical protein
MGSLAYIAVWLNAIANALGRWLLAPLGVLPGWLSATGVAAVSGVVLLLIFKYTSPQLAIKRVKDRIKANLLALKLFKDSAVVALRAQGGMLLGSAWLAVFALVPMLVMVVPVLLILGQMALWYQVRPLQKGEEALITLRLNGSAEEPLPEVTLQPNSAIETLGRVRVFSKREVCWSIKAEHAGYHRLVFEVGGQTVEKELAIGDGFMRVSTLRPGWDWSDILLNPAETPFRPDSVVRSIAIDYPSRASWTSGTDAWVIYWFVASMVIGFCFKGVLNVNV